MNVNVKDFVIFKHRGDELVGLVQKINGASLDITYMDHNNCEENGTIHIGQVIKVNTILRSSSTPTPIVAPTLTLQKQSLRRQKQVVVIDAEWRVIS